MPYCLFQQGHTNAFALVTVPYDNVFDASKRKRIPGYRAERWVVERTLMAE
jgi:hypothetical protein